MKEQFEQLLRSTKREGVEKVLEWLEKTDFYQAPASTQFHGNWAGGLVAHSMKVAIVANDLREVMVARKPELKEKITRENIIIAALLHDVCKANIYKVEKKNRKNAEGRWEEYMGYTTDYSECPLGHGEKSVIRLLQIGLKMTEDEILAIRWHMSVWDLAFQSYEMRANISAAADKCPLVSILQAADQLTAHIYEA